MNCRRGIVSIARRSMEKSVADEIPLPSFMYSGDNRPVDPCSSLYVVDTSSMHYAHCSQFAWLIPTGRTLHLLRPLGQPYEQLIDQ